VTHPGRVVEVGYLPNFTPRRFALYFETFPIWLLALEKSFCSSLIFLGVSSATDLKSKLEAAGPSVVLAHRAIGHLGLGRVRYSPTLIPPSNTITLVSGSPKFLEHATVRLLGRATLFLGDCHWPAKRAPSGPARIRLSHRSFGGPTHFVALFGCQDIPCRPLGTALRRSVGHVLDFGIRPDAVEFGIRPDAVIPGASTPHLDVDGILHPLELDRPILHPTSFYSSGWGTRALTADELGIAFGFPAWLRSGGLTVTMFPCVPLQIMDACIRQVLDTDGFVSPLAKRLFSATEAPLLATWLPRIQLYLPHTWVPVDVITDKAVKHDDAVVHTAMWDNRTFSLKLWPQLQAARVLVIFRTYLMRSHRHRLLTELRAHMLHAHGPYWTLRLASHRSPNHWSHHTKRVRSDTGQSGLERQRRGITWEEDWRSRDFIDKHELQRLLAVEQISKDGLSDIDDLVKDAAAGLDILQKASAADWWNWTEGSTLIFWRWPAGFQRKCARDGMPAWIHGSMPHYKRRAKTPKADDALLLAPKFLKILQRRYVSIPKQFTEIKSLIDYFYVPKAKDIRPVYNGASCGINEALWSPNFWLPTAKSALRVLDFGYFSVDIDLGEFFLNFPLIEILRQYSGIDLTPFAGILSDLKFDLVQDTDELYKVRWSRCWMGCKPSPYFAIRFYYWAEEFCRGNHLDQENSMRWDEILLNLPGDPEYNPSKPRVMKWNKELEVIAGDILGFVDDLRASGHSMEQAWAVARQVASRLQYLGIQDAPRKRRPPSQSPGAWAGAVFSTKDRKVTKSVTQEKWTKAQKMIEELLTEAGGNKDHEFSYKRLEQIRGFLCHMAMTYETITPFLKGLHLTLASFLPQRDDEGWKLSDKDWLNQIRDAVKEGKMTPREGKEAIDDERTAQESETNWELFVREKLDKNQISEDEALAALEATAHSGDPPPERIKGVVRFFQDLGALLRLFSADSPPEVDVRSALIYTILYGFADASGRGFGSTVLGKDGTRYRIGVWDKDTEGESSNFREFENVIETLEEEASGGHLKGAVIYLCTDNSTVESALYKGNSSSQKLFELVLRARVLEMQESVRILVSHVSGERMKAEGTDGTSRGQLREGVTIGESMLDFIPWNLTPDERSPQLVPWLKTWLGNEAEFLDPAGWFTRGHDHLGGSPDPLGFWHQGIKPGHFVWMPPPAAADVALEELRKARLKRQDSTHYFFTARLLTPEWQKQLWKTADLIFMIPPGSPGWPVEMFEPLTVGIVFPFLRHRPWQLKGTPKMFFLARQVHKMFEEQDLDSGDFLCKLLLGCRRFYSVPADVVRRLLFFESESSVLCQPLGKRGGRH
jgi:hypothetical protein